MAKAKVDQAVIEKPQAEEQVEPAALGREAGRRQHGDERRGERDRGVDARAGARAGGRPPFSSGLLTNSARIAPSRPRSRISPDQPGLVGVAIVLPHTPLVGRTVAADKGRDGSDSPDRRRPPADPRCARRAARAARLRVAGEACDGAEAIDEAARLEPDIVLLDLSMPGLDGLGALPRIRARRAGRARSSSSPPRAPRRTCSRRSAAGAAGYLLKSEPPERIAEFLRGVARGEAALSGAIARRLLDQVREGDGARRRASRTRSPARLSAREVEVLLLLDEHLGTDEIAKRLFISEHTVRSHVKSLLRKLGVSSRREALEPLRRSPRLTAYPPPWGIRFAGRGRCGRRAFGVTMCSDRSLPGERAEAVAP